MNIIVTILQITFGIAVIILALASIVLFIPFRWPAAAMWGLKVVVSALSSLFLLIGIFTAIAGIITGSMFISIAGVYVVLIYSIHFISVTRSPAKDFRIVFSKNQNQVMPGKGKYSLSSRAALKLPAVPEPVFEQDISYATIPGSDRQLLCDVWQPNNSVKRSGIAMIYIHGAAFYFLDKDFGTRPFFKHLAAQGHVIMDIANRLAPETDLMGMLHDVKRALTWMKENAERYLVDPDRIILAGGSSGGYLALMAAYTATDSLFTPIELEHKDLSCHGVIGVYPAIDLEALYYHTNQHLTMRSEPGKPKKKVPTEMPAWLKKRIGEKDFHRLGMDKGFENSGAIAPLMGGHPDECPDRYKFFSILTHVHSDCPPTLLIHGQHDIMAPVQSTRLLYEKLENEKIPALLHLLPQTDHAFDMFLPGFAPATHNAIYDVDIFLEILAAETNIRPEVIRRNEESAVY